jgi:hypothetical protein
MLGQRLVLATDSLCGCIDAERRVNTQTKRETPECEKRNMSYDPSSTCYAIVFPLLFLGFEKSFVTKPV